MTSISHYKPVIVILWLHHGYYCQIINFSLRFVFPHQNPYFGSRTRLKSMKLSFSQSFSIFFPPFFRHFPFISPHFFICFIIVLDNFMQFPTFSHHFLTIFLKSPHLSAPPSVPPFRSARRLQRVHGELPLLRGAAKEERDVAQGLLGRLEVILGGWCMEY